MKYYFLSSGYLTTVSETSELFALLQALPEGRRPAFLDETDPSVVAYLADKAAAAAEAAKPKEVTMRQARLALLGAGLLPTVELAIAAMTGTAGDAARIEWEYSNSLKRSQPLVTQLGAGLGLTVGQLDALFLTASTL
jgi:hypothetical protein